MMSRIPWWLRVPVLFFLVFGLMEYFIDSGDKPAIIEYPITQFFMLMVLLIVLLREFRSIQFCAVQKALHSGLLLQLLHS